MSFFYVLLGRVAVCTSKAACSHRPFPLTICWSVCLWVCLSVCLCLSSGLWKNGGSDPDAVWDVRRSDGSRDEAGSGVGDRSTGMGIFGVANIGRPHCNQWETSHYWEFPLRRCEVAAWRILRTAGASAGEPCKLSARCG